MNKFYAILGAALLVSGSAWADTAETAVVYKGYDIADAAYFKHYGLEMGAELTFNEAAVTFVSPTWGTFTFSEFSSTESNDTVVYSLSGTCAMPSMRTGTVTNYEAEGSITLTNTTASGAFTVAAVMGGTTVSFQSTDQITLFDIADCAYFKNYGFELGNVLSIDSLQLSSDQMAEGTAYGKLQYVSGTWGTYTIDTVTLCYDTDLNAVVIAGEGKTLMAGHGGTSEYAAEAALQVADGVLTGAFTVPAVMGGTTLTVGNAQAPYAYGVASTQGTTYTVNEIAKCAYFSNYGFAADQTLTITVASADSVVVSYTSPTWGTFTLDTVQVTYNQGVLADGVYTLSGWGHCDMPSMRDASVVTTYYAEVLATVQDGVCSGDLVVPGVMGGTTVSVGPDIADPTGIEQVESDAADASANMVFDLQGRVVTNPVSGQLYVKNGKKYFLK